MPAVSKKLKTAETVEKLLGPKIVAAVSPYKNGATIVYPKIEDNAALIIANEKRKALKLLMVEVDEGYDDLIHAANRLHRDLIAKKKVYYQPLKSADDAIERRMTEYRVAMEAARQEEEKRLQDEARKREQDRLAEEAAALERAGHHEEAAMVMDEAIQTPAPLVVAPSTIPHIPGSYSRDLPWKFEIIDSSKIRDEYWCPDLEAIAAVVKAKGEMAETMIGKGSIRVSRGSKTITRG